MGKNIVQELFHRRDGSAAVQRRLKTIFMKQAEERLERVYSGLSGRISKLGAKPDRGYDILQVIDLEDGTYLKYEVRRDGVRGRLARVKRDDGSEMGYIEDCINARMNAKEVIYKLNNGLMGA